MKMRGRRRRLSVWKRRVLLLFLAALAALGVWGQRYVRHPRLLTAAYQDFLVKRMLGGPLKAWWENLVRTLEVYENAVYIGMGTYLGVLDASDPTRPVLVQRFELFGIVHGMVRKGSVLYCAHGSGGVSSFDISDPLHPVYLQRLAYPGYQMHVAPMRGDLLLLCSEMSGWNILDIRDPARMVPLHGFEGGWVSAARVYGDTAYILDGRQGVVIYDLSVPAQPARLATVPIHMPKEVYEPDPPPIWMEARDGFAYVSNGSDGLRVLDVRDPAHPAQVGHLPLPQYTYSVALRGDRAFLANIGEGLMVVDISNPGAPRLLRSVPTVGNAYEIILAGDLGYVADGASGVAVFDLSDPDLPVQIGYYHVPAWTRGVTLAGDLLVTSEAGQGIRLFDVSERRSPRYLSSLDTPGQVSNVTGSGRTLYLSDSLGGFHSVDVSDPSRPRFLSHFSLQDHPWSSLWDGGLLYGAMGHHGFSVFDARSEPPRQIFNAFNVDREEDFGYTIRIGKAGDLALCGDINLGMIVYDVRDPVQAVQKGRYCIDIKHPFQYLAQGTFTTVMSIFGEGKRAYLAGYNRGLEIVNLEEPSRPQLEGRLPVDGHSFAVWKDGDQACLVTYEGELVLADVKDPARPRETRRIPVKGPLWDVVCEDGLAYVAAGPEGLAVVDLGSGSRQSFSVQSEVRLNQP